MMVSELPSVEIVLIGRNDNYHEDYIERTRSCLNYNLHALHEAGLIGTVKFLFVDWASKEPLSEVLTIEKKFCGGLRFVHLTDDYLIGNGLDSSAINLSYAGNFGLEFSDADFVFWGASDLIGHANDWRQLIHGLSSLGEADREKVLLTERTFLGFHFFSHRRSFGDLDFYISNYHGQSEAITGVGGSSALIGGSRSLMLALGGLNVKIQKNWGGHDPELYIRGTKYLGGINLSKRFGANYYKLPYARVGDRVRLVESSGGQWMDVIDQTVSLSDLKRNTPQALSSPRYTNNEMTFYEIQSPVNPTGISIKNFIKNIVFARPCDHSSISEVLGVKNLIGSRSYDGVVFDGSFDFRVPLMVSLICKPAVIFWKYPSSCGRAVVRFMGDAASPLLGIKSGIFSGVFHCIHENSEFYAGAETLNFLKDKQIIVFRRVSTALYWGEFQGDVLEPGNQCIGRIENFKLVAQNPKIFFALFLKISTEIINFLVKIKAFLRGRFG